ncbi:MAG TPA: hypothetical protein VGK27_10890 [Candidatus Deferrimicrobiaceae bacterium]
MVPVPSKTRPLLLRHAFRTAPAVLMLGFALTASAAPLPVPDNLDASSPAAFEQRRAVEKASRSRYRDLEIASLVLILAAGGVAVWWTLRRK